MLFESTDEGGERIDIVQMQNQKHYMRESLSSYNKDQKKYKAKISLLNQYILISWEERELDVQMKS